MKTLAVLQIITAELNAGQEHMEEISITRICKIITTEGGNCARNVNKMLVSYLSVAVTKVKLGFSGLMLDETLNSKFRASLSFQDSASVFFGNSPKIIIILCYNVFIIKFFICRQK